MVKTRSKLHAVFPIYLFKEGGGWDGREVAFFTDKVSWAVDTNWSLNIPLCQRNSYLYAPGQHYLTCGM